MITYNKLITDEMCVLFPF